MKYLVTISIDPKDFGYKDSKSGAELAVQEQLINTFTLDWDEDDGRSLEIAGVEIDDSE